MAIIYTARANLAKPAHSDLNWDAALNANADTADAVQAVGALNVVFAEIPSATLNVAVSAGVFRKSDGTLITYAGTAGFAVTTAINNFLWLTDAGVLTLGTGWPASTFHVRLATVLAGATTITSIADARVPFASGGANRNTVYLALTGGTFADGAGVVTIGCGTTNGTKFGAGVNDKFSFFGAAPIVQPSGASQAAIGTLATATLTDSTGGTATTTLAAGITDTVAKNAIASLAAQVNNALTDLNTLKTLANANRTALVALGLEKGSA